MITDKKVRGCNSNLRKGGMVIRTSINRQLHRSGTIHEIFPGNSVFFRRVKKSRRDDTIIENVDQPQQNPEGVT